MAACSSDTNVSSTAQELDQACDAHRAQASEIAVNRRILRLPHGVCLSVSCCKHRSHLSINYAQEGIGGGAQCPLCSTRYPAVKTPLQRRSNNADAVLIESRAQAIREFQ